MLYLYVKDTTMSKQPYIEEREVGKAKATILHTQETYPSQEEPLRKSIANWFADTYGARTIISVSTGRHQATWQVCWHSPIYNNREKDMTFQEKKDDREKRAREFLEAFEEFLNDCPPTEEELEATKERYRKARASYEKMKKHKNR